MLSLLFGGSVQAFVKSYSNRNIDRFHILAHIDDIYNPYLARSGGNTLSSCTAASGTLHEELIREIKDLPRVAEIDSTANDEASDKIDIDEALYLIVDHYLATYTYSYQNLQT